MKTTGGTRTSSHSGVINTTMHTGNTGYARRPLDLEGEIPCKAKELLM